MSSFNVFSANRFTTVDSISSIPPLFVRAPARLEYNPNVILPTGKGHHLKMSLNKHYVYGLEPRVFAPPVALTNIVPLSTVLVSVQRPKPPLAFIPPSSRPTSWTS